MKENMDVEVVIVEDTSEKKNYFAEHFVIDVTCKQKKFRVESKHCGHKWYPISYWLTVTELDTGKMYKEEYDYDTATDHNDIPKEYDSIIDAATTRAAIEFGLLND